MVSCSSCILGALFLKQDAAAGLGPEETASQSLWEEVLEIPDKEGEECVEIAVVAELVGSRSEKNGGEGAADKWGKDKRERK